MLAAACPTAGQRPAVAAPRAAGGCLQLRRPVVAAAAAAGEPGQSNQELAAAIAAKEQELQSMFVSGRIPKVSFAVAG